MTWTIKSECFISSLNIYTVLKFVRATGITYSENKKVELSTERVSDLINTIQIVSSPWGCHRQREIAHFFCDKLVIEIKQIS